MFPLLRQTRKNRRDQNYFIANTKMIFILCNTFLDIKRLILSTNILHIEYEYWSWSSRCLFRNTCVPVGFIPPKIYMWCFGWYREFWSPDVLEMHVDSASYFSSHRCQDIYAHCGVVGKTKLWQQFRVVLPFCVDRI